MLKKISKQKKKTDKIQMNKQN